MLYICATYDYELFLGGSSYSEKEVLIDPAQALLDLYSEMGIKATFFADVLSLIRYEHYGLDEFPQMAVKQLQDALKTGNDVQLHIHPQWLGAKWINGKWEHSVNEYKFADLSGSDRNEKIGYAIEKGRLYLEGHFGDVLNDYRVLAYRAGGYCLEPQEYVLPLLVKNGIIIDSSVISGCRSISGPICYDYKHISKMSGYYCSSEYGVVKPVNIGLADMFEMPIGTVTNSIEKAYYWLRYDNLRNRNPKGSFINDSADKTAGFRTISLLKSILNPNAGYLLTFDERRWNGMMYILNKIAKKADLAQEDVFVTIVGHPKMLTSELLDNTKEFFENVRARYRDIVRFVTMTEVARIIGNDRAVCS